MFQGLNFSRKAQLTHGAGENDMIPGAKIRQLYDEQIREQQRGADADALKDTTKSDFS